MIKTYLKQGLIIRVSCNINWFCFLKKMKTITRKCTKKSEKSDAYITDELEILGSHQNVFKKDMEDN